ncbi:MAG: hypothetical protein ABJH68_07285 [Ilumatobacter sp.]|uniref:hypothetical protein n=1 Tax=Ilumatobacter sp. TaxID=1967498 RepID=UPI003297EE2F
MRSPDSEIDGVIVCGAPRSGTSMMAQALADAGFGLGNDLIAGSEANPLGFFEDIEVNRINDGLLAAADVVPGAARPPRSLWWLGAFEATATPSPAPETLARRIPPAPYVLKDPRFSHTYPAWRPVLSEHRVVVMVRPVAEVHQSLVAMARRDPEQFAGWELSEVAVWEMWSATYASIDRWADDGVAYVADSTLRDRSVLGALSEFLGRPISAPGVAPELRRTAPTAPTERERPVFERCLIP